MFPRSTPTVVKPPSSIGVNVAGTPSSLRVMPSPSTGRAHSILRQIETEQTSFNDANSQYERACRTFGLDIDPLITSSLAVSSVRAVNFAGRIQNDDIAVAVAAGVSQLRSVERVTLDCAIFTATGITAWSSLFRRLTTLQYLSLRGCNLRDAPCALIMETLGHCKNLRRLDLSDNSIGSAGAGAIAQYVSCSGLVELVLDMNQLGVEGAKHIAQALLSCQTLDSVFMGSNAIGNDGAAYIGEALESSACKMLYLWRNNIGDDGCAAIGAALAGNSNLNVLNLAENVITAIGVTQLAAGLETNTTLHSVLLWGNRLDDDGAKSIGDILCAKSIRSCLAGYSAFTARGSHAISQALRSSQIQVLSIEHSKIGDNGGVLIFAALHHNQTLHTLSLAGCGLGLAAVSAFSGYLRSNRPGLLHIDLSDNKFGNDGGRYLSSALAANRTLISISLDNCEIGDTGAVSLAAGIQQQESKTLKTLTLCSNAIAVVGGTPLVEMTRECSLQHLALQCNDIPETTTEQLQAICRERQIKLTADGVDPILN